MFTLEPDDVTLPMTVAEAPASVYDPVAPSSTINVEASSTVAGLSPINSNYWCCCVNHIDSSRCSSGIVI